MNPTTNLRPNIVMKIMKKLIRNLSAGCLCLLVLSSCCDQRDEVYWFPDEAVRYYNEHDTVKFYCPENDVLESYAVCTRDTPIQIEQIKHNQFCEYVVYRHTLYYKLDIDSCGSSKSIVIFIDLSRSGNISVSIAHPDNDQGRFSTYFHENTTFSINVIDHTYHNVVEISGSESSEIPSILFSYEYGVIQINYENQTFSFVNDEN